MDFHRLKDISKKSKWVKVEPILKGWSEDEKYYIEDDSGDKLLLRLSDISLYEKRKNEFENIRLVSKFGINMSVPIEFGVCNDGKSVYSLLTWVEGEDATDGISKLDKERQYELGLKAGEILKKIHTIKPTKDLPSWESFFQNRIDVVIQAYKDSGYKFKNDEDIISFIKENQKLLAGRTMTYMHGDYHLGNMIITRDGDLGIIDFNRSGYGDPWKEYDRFVFTWSVSQEFANGQLHGYFENNVPDEFFRLMALYSARNLIASIPWSLQFGEKELKVAFENIEKVSNSYDGYKNYIPNWYKEYSRGGKQW